MNVAFLWFIGDMNCNGSRAKFNMNPFGVHLLCTRPVAVHTPINHSSATFIS